MHNKHKPKPTHMQLHAHMHANPRSLALVAGTALFAVACPLEEPPPEGDAPTVPDVAAATFVAAVTNPFHPLPIGATWTYEATDGAERVEIVVLDEPFDVNGVAAVQVKDSAFIDGVLAEETTDWYAQDDAGNVWYLGEDTCELEDGACVDTAGSWRYGQNGALPGIIMPATPTVDGERYYQEYLPGEAEDVGEVVADGVDVSVPAGNFTGCITTHDTSTLDPALDEKKTYCSGVGNVLVEEDPVNLELIASSLVTP